MQMYRLHAYYVYADANCFEDRNETKEKLRVAKVFLYITCSTWLNFLFHLLVSSCKFQKRKFNFVLQVRLGKLRRSSIAQNSSNILRFDLDLQQILQDISLSFV